MSLSSHWDVGELTRMVSFVHRRKDSGVEVYTVLKEVLLPALLLARKQFSAQIDEKSELHRMVEDLIEG